MRRTACFLAAGLLLFAGCGGDDNPAVDAGGSPDATATAAAAAGSVTASDQTSDGMKIVVAQVVVGDPAGGFIAVHIDQGGGPGPVVGHSALLKQGTNSNVTVTLDQKQATGDYWPMLHNDVNKNGAYDFPGADVPAKDAAGQTAMKKVHLTVA